MASRRRPLTIVRNVLLAAVLLVLALAGLEGLSSFVGLVRGYRALRPPPANFRQATYDSLIGWVGIPNLAIADNYGPGLSLTTNAEGMRIHRPVTAALAPDERRVICSGDSFTFGSGVGDRETFCAALERELPGVRTLNMAQRGYGNDQAYLRYRRDAGAYRHQLHLFAFIWNDFERMALTSFTGYPKPVLALRDGAIVTGNVPVPEWKGWTRRAAAPGLLSRLRLMQLIRERVNPTDSAKMGRVDAQVLPVVEPMFRDLARLARDRGSELILVYLPAPPDLQPGAWDVRRRKLADIGRRTGVTLIDLTDEIRRLPADTLDWMFITEHALSVDGASGHYTARGHDWVAARLAAHFRDLPAVWSALGQGTPALVAAGDAR